MFKERSFFHSVIKSDICLLFTNKRKM